VGSSYSFPFTVLSHNAKEKEKVKEIRENPACRISMACKPHRNPHELATLAATTAYLSPFVKMLQ